MKNMDSIHWSNTHATGVSEVENEVNEVENICRNTS